MSETEDRPPISETIAEAIAKRSKHLETARKFYRTKVAIQSGLPLFDWSSADLQTSGYLGPWKFNAIETAITGGLASFILNVANSLSASKPEESGLVEGLDPALASI